MSKCRCCYGSGKVLGLGNVKRNCTICDGRGMDKIDEKSERRKTKSYKQAKERLKNANPDLLDSQAEGLLDDEIERVINVQSK